MPLAWYPLKQMKFYFKRQLSAVFMSYNKDNSIWCRIVMVVYDAKMKYVASNLLLSSETMNYFSHTAN